VVQSCPGDVTTSTGVGNCDIYLTLDKPTATDLCGQTFTITHSSPYSTNGDLYDASGIYPIGVTTIIWTITDESLNSSTCTQVITVTGVPPAIACPADITAPADFEKLYKEFVNVGPPTVTLNCPIESLTWVMTGVTTDTSSATGTNTLTTHSFNLGVTNVTYTVTDDHGLSASCTFTVTITGKPVIDCPADIVTNTTSTGCTQMVNPGFPELISGTQTITWTWTITDPSGLIQDSGTFIGSDAIPGPPDLGDKEFKLGTSTITWTATNLAGTASCTHTVTVEDKEPPKFTLPTAFSECVEKIQEAEYYAPTIDITPTRPEYYILEPGDGTLDLTGLWDNCCATESLTVNWRIEFTDPANPTGPRTAGPAGTKQLSDYGTPIEFPGDGVTFLNVIHHIFYWVEDCHGNVTTPEQSFDITITPRPQIIKMN
jgi:hypothetical protein